MDWNDLRYLTAVYRAGSLTGAARALGVSVQTAGRRIAALENALGTLLFVRHAAGYVPTSDCVELIEDAYRIEEAVGHLQANAGGRSGTVRGIVRIAAPETIATHFLLPGLASLLRAHQDLKLEFVTGVGHVGIARGEADLAVRLVPPERGALTVRRLGVMSHGLYAASNADADLSAARLIGWTAEHDLPASRWLRRLTGREPDVRLNSLQGQVAAIAAGIGIGIIPSFLSKNLRRLPTELIMEEPLWLVGHAAIDVPTRVRIVRDALVNLFTKAADELGSGST